MHYSLYFYNINLAYVVYNAPAARNGGFVNNWLLYANTNKNEYEIENKYSIWHIAGPI